MPQVVTRFLEVIQDPNFDYEKVVKVLSADAGTVSEILRLANSALFGVSRKVTSLRQALTLLGPRRTRSLVLGRYLVEAMSGSGHGTLDMTYFWRRSLASAVIGARLADSLCPKLRDEVFLSGLLADIGIGILAQALPEKYGPFIDRYAPGGVMFTPEEEIASVETTHTEVASVVLGDWALPADMCDAVRFSHDNSVSADSNALRIAMIINASDRVAKLISEIPDADTCVEPCTEAMAFVGVESGLLVDILKDVEADVEELALILKIDVIPSSVYSKIAEAIKERLTVAT